MPGFVFGTMHVKDDAVHRFVDRVTPCLEEATLYAAEMNLAEVDPAMMMASKRLPGGQSLMEYLGHKKYQKIRKSILKSFDVDLNYYQRLHPFLVIALVSEKVISNDHRESLDHVLWHRAQQLDIPRTGLESFKQQMTIMEKITVDLSLRQLRQIARNPNILRREVIRMLDYYQQQDVKRLYQVSKKQLKQLKKLLLYDRNHSMAQSILELASDHHLFAAFGAGHLAGSRGVLRYLKHAGCRIEPIFI